VQTKYELNVTTNLNISKFLFSDVCMMPTTFQNT